MGSIRSTDNSSSESLSYWQDCPVKQIQILVYQLIKAKNRTFQIYIKIFFHKIKLSSFAKKLKLEVNISETLPPYPHVTFSDFL
jgi:hypothetical protein